MAGNYSHITRAVGTTLTASIYNADHQNHITNQTPVGTDGYQTSIAEKQIHADPNAALSGSLAEELAQIRWVLRTLGGVDQWYLAGNPAGAPPYSIVFMHKNNVFVNAKLEGSICAFAGSILRVELYADNLITGADCIIDLNKNGTSIWSVDQTKRAKVVIGQNAGNQTLFDTTTVARGDRIDFAIDQASGGGNWFRVALIFGQHA